MLLRSQVEQLKGEKDEMAALIREGEAKLNTATNELEMLKFNLKDTQLVHMTYLFIF